MDQQVPMAVPQAQPEPATFNDVASGRNAPPPQAANVDNGDALAMLQKLSAEIQGRDDDAPVVIPIGYETIRIYQEMSAEYLVEAANAERSTSSAIRTLRAAVIEEDRAKFDEILRRPATREGKGLKGTDILQMLKHLLVYYGGRPLDERSL